MHTVHYTFDCFSLANKNSRGLSKAEQLIGLVPTKKHKIYARYTLVISCIVTGRKAVLFVVTVYF